MWLSSMPGSHPFLPFLIQCHSGSDTVCSYFVCFWGGGVAGIKRAWRFITTIQWLLTDRQKTSQSRNWVKEDMERLVCWMEENQQSLRGKRVTIHSCRSPASHPALQYQIVRRLLVHERKEFNHSPDVFQHSFTLSDSGDVFHETKQL